MCCSGSAVLLLCRCAAMLLLLLLYFLLLIMLHLLYVCSCAELPLDRSEPLCSVFFRFAPLSALLNYFYWSAAVLLCRTAQCAAALPLLCSCCTSAVCFFQQALVQLLIQHLPRFAGKICSGVWLRCWLLTMQMGLTIKALLFQQRGVSPAVPL